MTIPSYRLPPHIEIGSQFAPTFNNVIQESIAGNEQRFARWTKCRGVGNLAYGLLDSEDHTGDFHAILALYRAHFESIYPFRFRDWSDYTASDELIGNGDGSETEFQLVKTYDPSQILLGTPGSLFYVRAITLVSSTPTIKVDGVAQTPTTDYTISSSGLVTFSSAPAGSTEITWTGEFDVPVRFDGPLQIAMREAGLATISSAPIKEVIGE